MVMEDFTGKLSDTGEAKGTKRAEGVQLKPSSENNQRHAMAGVAPELLRGEQETIASDSYSLGMCIYYAVLGRSPWSVPGANGNDCIPADMLEAIAQNKAVIKFPEEKGLPWDDRVKELILALCASTPAQRMRAMMVVDILRTIRGVVVGRVQ